MKTSLVTLLVTGLLTSLLVACGQDDDPVVTPVASRPDATRFFNRTSTFAVCAQPDASCESGDTRSAEIVAASSDGMTLIYTDSPAKQIGFVDISDVHAPLGLGSLAMGGEPTSVAVRGNHALVAVNASTDFVNTSGTLAIVDISSRTLLHSIALPGQPDSVSISPDGKYIAVVIENERDEDVNDGELPQLPAGSLVVVDAVGEPSAWTTRTVDLRGLALIAPQDPEPEYVDINDDNIAVVTLQENNHLVLVDLKTAAVLRHFSAGSVDLQQVDLVDAPRPNQVNLNQNLAAVKREPDGVTWISSQQFITANEGDLDGGSRSFTVFNADGTVAWEAGNQLEHLMARIGHYNDKRSDAKGNEPENAAFARFVDTDYVFIASERSSVLAVYDLSTPSSPVLKQTLPAALSPEGVLAIPSRNLLIAASEVDDRSILARSSLNIYQYQTAAAAYPTIVSSDRDDGTPIPWGALSGLAAAPAGSTLYAIEDSFFAGTRIFELDAASHPAVLRREIRITDPDGRIAALAASLPDSADATQFDDIDLLKLVNANGSVNIDAEGIAVASEGGFWVASEGNGTVGDGSRPVLSANLVFKLSAAGVIERVIQLPSELGPLQTRFGLEGIAESDGKLVVAFQRAWAGESHARIGIYDLESSSWSFVYYPLDIVASPNGGWVGLSDITALGNQRFLLVERDNQGGPDARIKRLYRIDLSAAAPDSLLAKTLVRDLMPDLRRAGGLVPEKIEGSARMANGDVFIVNDNDGVDDNSGEVQLINLGRLPL